MNKRATGLVLAGVLVTGAVGAVAVTPASATTSTNPVSSRLASLKNALSSLVSDGTLTQAQADKVAGTLDTKLPKGGEHGMRGPGGRFGGMGLADTRDAAAKALGLTSDKLRAALEGGKSLADVAKVQKVSIDSVIKAMVTAAEKDLATAVKEGKITQVQADKMKSSLAQRITDGVNRARPERGQGHGFRGPQAPVSTGDTSGGTSGTALSTT